MRVLHLVKTAHGATWALRQMEQLVRLGVDVHVALPEGPLVKRYEAAGIMTHIAQFDLPVRKPHLWPNLFTRLRGVIQNVKPDVIHSHFVGTTLTMRLALGRSHYVPRLFQVPGPLHLEHMFFRLLEINLAGPADWWIGSCRWTCKCYLRSGIRPERIFLSYYGIDTQNFRPAPRGTLRDELGVAPDAHIVGMVAYMYAPKRYLGQRRGLKGHEDLIDALALIRNRRPNVFGVFAGGAWDSASWYEKQVRAYGRKLLGSSACFLGTRSDIPRIYADLDVVVHPSHSENVGGAAESLLLGVPTIATNVGGFPDIVIPGSTGWLVPPRYPPYLAGAIESALADPERGREMATNGQNLVRTLFDIRRTALEIKEIYEMVVKKF